MSKRKEYNDAEHRAIAAAYVRLAVAQYNGEKVNKAAMIRGLQAAMPQRTRGAIEAKLMNLSAVAVELELLPALPGGYVKGYKPAPNGAKALKGWLMVALERNGNAEPLVSSLPVVQMLQAG